tara:strand:- start:281 stop:610 length:330 start_codon:yes stop_codon:yes gene_type:complete
MTIFLGNQTAKLQRPSDSVTINGLTVDTRWHKPCSTVNPADTRFKLTCRSFNIFLLLVGRLDVGFNRHSEPQLVCDVTVDLTADQVRWSHQHPDPNKADDYQIARHASA